MTEPSSSAQLFKDRLEAALWRRWPAGPLVLGVALVAIAGIPIPVSPGETGTDRATRSILANDTPEPAPAEDLTGFLAIHHWRGSEEQEARAPVE